MSGNTQCASQDYVKRDLLDFSETGCMHATCLDLLEKSVLLIEATAQGTTISVMIVHAKCKYSSCKYS